MAGRRRPSVSTAERPKGSGKYSVRWREHGRQREERGYTDPQDAEDAADEIRQRLRRGLPGIRETRTLASVVAAWWDGFVSGPTISTATRETYRTDIGRALDTLGAQRDAAHLTSADLARWIRDNHPPLSVRQINKTLTALGSCFRYAVEQGIVEQNPVRGVRRLREQRGLIAIPSLVDLEDLQRLAPSDRDRTMLRIAAYAGLRQSELLGLERRHLPLADNAIVVEQIKDRGGSIRATTKTNHARRVPIPTAIRDDITTYLERYPRKPDELVFQTDDGGDLRREGWSKYVWMPWRRALAWERAANGGEWERVLTLEWKQWRHFAISRWVTAGATPLQCSRWAGHTSFKLTMDRYGFLFDDDETAVMGRL